MAGRTKLEIGQGTPPRTLVCDDNPVNCALAKSVLEREHFQVTTCSTGEEAYQLLRRNTFDAVLLDVQLPGIDGLDLTRQLRAELPEQAFLPIILITASTNAETRLKGLQAGATDFITKPFDPHELVARITNFVATKRLYDRLAAANRALEEERQKVYQVQTSLLPASLPNSHRLHFAALYKPSRLAGGDYYDVIVRPCGKILLAVADVSGHGIPSAMHMSVLRAGLHARAKRGLEISQILEELNDVLVFATDEFTFVTFYLAEYNPETRCLLQATAGHPGPFLQDLQAETVRELEVEGSFPLGIEEGITYPVVEKTLNPGQRLVLYTDGIVEQGGESTVEKDVFGLERFRRSLVTATHLGLDKMPDFVFHQVRMFAGGEALEDDITLLAMEVRE